MREFQALARLSEADGHLQQRIKQLLKLSKEKWDAACDHAKTAVQVHAPVYINFQNMVLSNLEPLFSASSNINGD